MRDLERINFQSLRGRVLVAHPRLMDPNFRRSIVLISEHTQEEGALGVVLNRSLSKVLSEFRSQYEGGVLADVPVFEGGPVQTDGLILAAWRWQDSGDALQLHFGATPEQVIALLEEQPDYTVRAYLGHAGWGEGQVEGELNEKAWLVQSVSGEILDRSQDGQLWRDTVIEASPELRLIVDAPDDPSVN